MAFERFAPGLLLALALLLSLSQAQVDRTREDGAKGSAMVEAVLAELHDSCIYPEDNYLLRRIAFVETRDGTDPDTYATPGSGGIWRVNQAMLQRTQTERARLSQEYDLIKNKLGIDWSTVTWADMRRPLYSALAAAMFLTLEGAPGNVPASGAVDQQASYWLAHYHKGQSGNLMVQNFTYPVQNLQQSCARTEKMDIAFLVDYGGGVGPAQWSSITKFIDNIVINLQLHNGIGPDKDRVAMVTFSDNARLAFGFSTGTDMKSVLAQVANAPTGPGATNISAALVAAQSMVFSQARPDAAKVAVLIVDGRDLDRVALVMNLMPLRLNHVTVFAVGVGVQVDAAQVKEVASNPDCAHAYFVNSHHDLENLTVAVERISCRVPVVLGPGEYTYPCGFNVLAQVSGGSLGTSVTVTAEHGSVGIFGSYSTQLPSEDVHDLNHTATNSTPAVIFTRDPRPLTFSLESADHHGLTCNGNYRVRVDGQTAKRSVCNGHKPDIAILLDATLVRSDADWSAMLGFVQSFVQQFEVSPTAAHIALVSYADTPTTHFTLGQYTSSAAALQAIRAIQRPAPTTTSNLAAALTFAHDQVFTSVSGSRGDTSKTLIVVTPGQPQNAVQAVGQAAAIHAIGTRVVVVAVGNVIDDVNINAMASGAQHVQKVPDVTAMTAAVSNIIKEACGEVSVLCVEDGINRPCNIEDLINQQYGIMLEPDRTVSVNPCALQAATAGSGGVQLDRFPHPSDADKFLLCDSSGQAYIVLCPMQELYNPLLHVCQNPTAGGGGTVPMPTTTTTTTTTARPTTTQHHVVTTTTSAPTGGNPCTPDVVISQQFFLPYPADPTKYYHCTDTPYVGQLESCPTGKMWYQSILQCIYVGVIVNPATYQIDPSIPNPCTSSAPAYFPAPNNPNNFIQCNAAHEGYLMHCNPGETWSATLHACH